MTDRELMQMALDALDWKLTTLLKKSWENHHIHEVVKALRDRLAQPEQDSGGCRRCGGVGCDACDARCLMQLEWHSLAGTKREWFDGMVEATFAAGNDETVSVITHESVKDVALNYLPKRKWVGLTDEEIDAAMKSCNTVDTYKYFRAIEAKLKEKNNV